MTDVAREIANRANNGAMRACSKNGPPGAMASPCILTSDSCPWCRPCACPVDAGCCSRVRTADLVRPGGCDRQRARSGVTAGFGRAGRVGERPGRHHPAPARYRQPAGRLGTEAPTGPARRPEWVAVSRDHQHGWRLEQRCRCCPGGRRSGRGDRNSGHARQWHPRRGRGPRRSHRSADPERQYGASCARQHSISTATAARWSDPADLTRSGEHDCGAERCACP